MAIRIAQNKRFIFWLLLGSGLLAPFVVLSSRMEPWRGKYMAASWVQELIYPFEWASHFVENNIFKKWATYVALTDVAKENLELKKRVAILETQLTDYDHQLQEVARLRKLVGFTKLLDKSFLAAEVVHGDDHGSFATLRINRGGFAQIAEGMPVLVGEGIVGRVIRVGSTFSDVHLLSDSSFTLDVLIERTRVRGALRGISGGLCQLQLQQYTEVRIGDTIMTSGIVGSFPKGLPVGRVVKISYATDDVAQQITVEPFVDYRRLEEVMVVMQHDPYVEDIATKASRDWFTKSLDRTTR